MEIQNIFLHHIDINTPEPIEIELDENTDNIQDYIEGLVQDILDNPNRRFYNFKGGTTEVKNSLPHFLSESDELKEQVLNNAKRLLEKEKKTQKQYGHITDVLKGSLMHICCKDDSDRYNIIICKVEHDEVINEVGFDLIRGLNTRKKLFKAILICYDDNEVITHNYVFDKNSSRYWWDDFLELEKNITDEDNTENSLHEIDKSLMPHKKKFYADYLIVRNSLIGHYRNNDVLNYGDIVDKVFKNYTPVNPDFPKDKLVKKIEGLPEKKGFDTQFDIVKTKINKRAQHKVKLSNNLFLSLEGYVDNLKNIITPYEENGTKYLRILSNDGYEFLKDLLEKNDN